MREKQLTTKSAARKSEITFYTLMIALPILQFVIFYVVVNANSFLLAFEKYDSTLGKYVWVGMDNIVDQIKEFQSGGILYRAVFSSLRVYGLSLLMLPLEVLFPYYIYKKLPGASFFKVILFLPHILSSLVLTLLYQYFVNTIGYEYSRFNAWGHFVYNSVDIYGVVWFYDSFDVPRLYVEYFKIGNRIRLD